MNEFKSLKAINDACADATISEVRYSELLERFKSEIRAEERTKAIDECIAEINRLNLEIAYPHTICNILEMLKVQGNG